MIVVLIRAAERIFNPQIFYLRKLFSVCHFAFSLINKTIKQTESQFAALYKVS